ncbi:GGDEF domain-containing protein [Fundidesulfovibrio putealis]|nr:GGDEF domain-containing protein [Fundidesulfovibrio putealis]
MLLKCSDEALYQVKHAGRDGFAATGSALGS